MKKNLLSTSFNIKSELNHIAIPYLEKVDVKPDTSEGHIHFQSNQFSSSSRMVQLERYQISTKSSKDLVSDLLHFHGVDARSIMESTIYQEFLVKKESLLYSLYLENAKIKLEPKESKFGGWIRKKLFSGKDFIHYIKDENNEGSTKVVDLIYEACFRINVSSGFGPGNFVVCSPRIGALIMNHTRFTFTPDDIQPGNPINIEMVGHLNSGAKIEIYINPNLTWDNTTIIVGRSNGGSMENGTYVIDKNDSPTIESIESSHNLEDVTRGVHYMAVGNISRESSSSRFMRIEIATGEKPFWRKLLYLFGVE